jgi:hypothetical protein
MALKSFRNWLPGYVWGAFKKRHRPQADTPVHLLLCIADHFEPGNGCVSAERARRRVATWGDRYPKALGNFRDSDGQPPRHSFFYPMEQYVESDVNALAELCRAGFGEIEIHLHHHNDTAENLRGKLLDYKQILSQGHGLLGRDLRTGEAKYGFIHGDWALGNSLPDGSCCGVNDELNILRETGCYADFTLPAFPSSAQTRKINSIYYAKGDPNHARSHDHGIDAGSAPAPDDALMLIQGPLVLQWRSRKWGILPRVENGCIQANQSLHVDRVDNWFRAGVRVMDRPDWYFAKLHTHGATEANAPMLIGESAIQFHQDLADRARHEPNFRYHYVTAREMYNLALAAQARWSGSVAQARDFHLLFIAAPSAASRPSPNRAVSV